MEEVQRHAKWHVTCMNQWKVYVGGGDTHIVVNDDDYLIREYSPTDERWSTLPPAPVRLFGMGKLNGQLVIVGGPGGQDKILSQRKVHIFDSSSQAL